MKHTWKVMKEVCRKNKCVVIDNKQLTDTTINFSFKESAFLEKLKMAKIAPIFKTDKKELLTNYSHIISTMLFKDT